MLPGHEVRILTEDLQGPDAEAALQAGQAYTLALQIPGWAKPFGQFWRMKPYYDRALAIRKTYPWDVLVYINAFQGGYALWRGHVPVLGMINDYILAQASWQNALRNPGQARHFMFKCVERWVARRLPLVMTNSHYLASVLAKEYNVLINRLPVVYKTVDVAKFSFKPNRAWPEPGQPWHILFVKTNYQVGGLPELCQALGALPQHNFTLEVVGPTAPYHAHIASLVAAHANISLLLPGSLPQAAVHQRLYAAHIFCVPSRQEALGIANMEAALAGTPIVSTTTGGIPEVLDGGAAAYLAPAGQPQALANALLACITQPDDRAARQARARAFVVKTFNKKHMLETFVSLCRQGVVANNV